MATIILADDHQVVRQGLRAFLESEPGFEVIGEAVEGPQAVKLVSEKNPDVLVLDLMMPGLNGLEVARQVAQQAPRTRVVILSMHTDEAYVSEALRNGAIAYVLKGSSATDLVEAIHNAIAGRRFLSPALSERGNRGDSKAPERRSSKRV